MSTVSRSCVIGGITIRMREEFLARKVASFYAGLFMWSVVDHEIYVRLIAVTNKKRDTLQFKSPGGDAVAYEDPRETVARELREEVLRPNSKVEVPEEAISQVYSVLKPDDRLKGFGWHHEKLWFGINESLLINFRGDMHFRGLPVRDGDDVVSPSLLLPLSGAARVLYKTHIPAMAALVWHLAAINSEMFSIIPERLLLWAQSSYAQVEGGNYEG